MRITFFGSGEGNQGDTAYDRMRGIGGVLAQLGHVVVTGGFGGSGMEAPARGAIEAGGHSIGYTMLGMTSNDYLSESIDVGLQIGISDPELQFTARLGRLMQSDAFILDSGGGIGSLVEFITWANLNSKIWKKAKTPKRMAVLPGGGVEDLLRSISDTFSPDVRDLIRFRFSDHVELFDWILG